MAVDAATNPAPAFAVDADSIDPAVFGLTSYASPTSPAPRVSRLEAIQVPAVKRARDLIAGTLGTLPIDLFGTNADQFKQLLEQPESDTPRSVTMTRTYEDMLFEGVAWWRITEMGWHGYPTRVRRLNPRSVNVRQDGRVFYAKDGSSQGVADEWIPDAQLIRFDSPNDALLVAGARAIRTILHLENAAKNYAEGAPPVDYFTPSDDADPADDDEIIEILNQWQASRQSRSTGYVPASLKYNVGGWNPEQLQLADARQHAVLEIARLAGVDPEAIGVSTTSRTYFNAEHKRKEFVDFTLGGYMTAMEGRMSMGDVTPRGYYARVNLDSFLRSDTKTRFEAYEIGLRTGAVTRSEIRELEDREPLTAAEEAAAIASIRAVPDLPKEDAS